MYHFVLCTGESFVYTGLRTLGIPARCVTNSDSAHDTDGSLTIDKYFDFGPDDSIIENSTKTFDSIW